MIQCHFSCDTKRRQIKEIEKIAFDNIDRLEASSASYPRNTGLKVYGSTSGWFLSSRFLFYFEISPLRGLVSLFTSSCVFFPPAVFPCPSSLHLFLIPSLGLSVFVLRVVFVSSSVFLGLRPRYSACGLCSSVFAGVSECLPAGMFWFLFLI